MDYSNLFVCLMGLCTVFIGLICIIILVSVMSGIVRKTDKTQTAEKNVSAVPAAAAGSRAAIPASAGAQVTPELVAAVSAAIAEEMGTDVNAIRILSIKRK